MNLLHNLNPEQLAAVTLPSQSALILAGAGSGKTRVLTTRIAWLIQTGQVSPAGIMAVTFTNKAAKEMLTRLSAMLPINTRGMWIGTFHGLCNRLLRTHYRDAALPQTFQILDSQDQLSMIKRLLKARTSTTKSIRPRPDVLHQQRQGPGPARRQVEPTTRSNARWSSCTTLYDQQCQREGVVDFAELLLRAYELLSRNQPLRQHYQMRFKHILVDEFQDTNDLQYNLLKLLAGHGEQAGGAIFAVGDDDQSIYAFRGANVGNMRLRARVQGQEPDQAGAELPLAWPHPRQRQLPDRNNSKRLGKNLRTDAGQGEPVRIYEASSDLEEAQWIIEEAKSLMAEGLPRSEIAILYRSNAQSRVIEHALFAAGIPYTVYGGLRYFQRAEVKHAIAYLQLMDNPHNDSAFLRVVNFPTRGIGVRSIEQLQMAADTYGVSLYAAVPYMTGKAGTSLGGFVKLIEGARFETQQLALPEMVRVVLERSNLLDALRRTKKKAPTASRTWSRWSARPPSSCRKKASASSPRPTWARRRRRSRRRDRQPGRHRDLDADAPLPTVMSPLSAFLAHASLEAGDAQAQAGQEAMQLMTVHSAKGLEFDAVFITGLEEGLFPHESSSRELDGVDEERRLMYVAITRARKRLYMSFTQQRMLHGQTRYNMKSRFFDELPEESLKWLSPRVQSHWFANKKSPRPGTTRLPRGRQRQQDRPADHPEISSGNGSAGASASRWRTPSSARA
jgi:DNA helicase-2/ATP-dependent DNA helicase PcrA